MAKRRAEYLQGEMARGYKRPRGRPPTNATLQRDGSSSVYILNGMSATSEAVAAAREARKVVARRERRRQQRLAAAASSPAAARERRPALALSPATVSRSRQRLTLKLRSVADSEEEEEKETLLNAGPGWRVYRRAVRVSTRDVRAVEEIARKGEPIFNGGDRLRRQASLPASGAVAQQLLLALQKRGELRGRELRDAVAIHSAAGCGQQPLHHDYNPEALRGQARKPAGALLALEHGARMRVMGEHGVRMICLEPGDALVFDGDVVHAGAAYRAPNTRVHVYLDVPSVKREHDRTYSYKH